MHAEDGREINIAFCLFATCRIEYEGRASSRLEEGNYLIIHKEDGSIQIHGGSKITPLNYQPPGGKLYADGRSLTAVRKSETLTIHVTKRIFLHKLSDLSDNKIVLVRTEKDIVRALRSDLSSRVPNREFVHVEAEARTEVGPCDLLCIDSVGTYHVFEAKRTAITINAVVQLGKYVESLRETGKSVEGYVVAPHILDNAQKHADKRGVKFIRVLHAPDAASALAELDVDDQVLLPNGES